MNSSNYTFKYPKKPLIKFTYNPTSNPTKVLPVIPKIKELFPTTSFSQIEQLSSLQKLQKEEEPEEDQIQLLRGSYRRKKIFQQGSDSIKQEKEQSVSSSLEKNRGRTKSALHYSEFRQKKKRNNIFQDYNPKVCGSMGNSVQTVSQDSHFPLPKPPVPKSLVKYVDLSLHRKKKQISPSQSAKRRTYMSDIRKEEKQNISDLRIFEENSLVPDNQNRNLSEVNFEFDESVRSCSHREVNNTKQDFGELLQTVPRFYDKPNTESIPHIAKTNSYVDIKLLKSSDSTDWNTLFHKKETFQSSEPMFAKKIQEIYSKIIGNKNSLPWVLIAMGLILLLIQLIK